MQVLITGVAGFIGANLARTLSAKMSVVGIDDLSTGSLLNLKGINLEFVNGSILDRQILARAMENCDAIVHLAARPSVPRSLLDPLTSHETNATGTVYVLEEARKLSDPLVILASSSSVYGSHPGSIKSESLTPMPMSPYAVSKLATEQYACAWNHSFGLRTLSFRFFNVYGPLQDSTHDYAAVIPSFLQAAIDDRPLTIYGDGSQTRDFTFVDNVCQVIQDALTQDVSHVHPVNLAFGTQVSLLQLVDMMEALLGRPLRRLHREPRRGDVLRSQADSTVLRQLFPGISPIDLTEGLSRTFEWLKNQ